MVWGWSVVTEWEGGLRLRLIRPAWRDVTSPDWSTELVALAMTGVSGQTWPANVRPNFLVPAHSHLHWAGSVDRFRHIKTDWKFSYTGHYIT